MSSDEHAEPFAVFVHLFNARRYHSCVAPLEELWFAQRDDFHKALIRMCVGCNQIELGLDSGPRFLFTTARELLVSYGDTHNGLDLVAVQSFLAAALAVLDDPLPRVVPSFQIEWLTQA